MDNLFSDDLPWTSLIGVVLILIGVALYKAVDYFASWIFAALWNWS